MRTSTNMQTRIMSIQLINIECQDEYLLNSAGFSINRHLWFSTKFVQFKHMYVSFCIVELAMSTLGGCSVLNMYEST